MKTKEKPWFSLSSPDSSLLRCAACGKEVDLGGPSADHHPRVCPECGIACVFLNWKDRLVQIVLSAAPARLPEVIGWLQQNFDELDYVSLICSLEEIADAVHADSEQQVR